jgi:hypothetical protein
MELVMLSALQWRTPWYSVMKLRFPEKTMIYFVA